MFKKHLKKTKLLCKWGKGLCFLRITAIVAVRRTLTFKLFRKKLNIYFKYYGLSSQKVNAKSLKNVVADDDSFLTHVKGWSLL